LALLNFGIDEFVNPRLRGTGSRKVRTASGKIARMRVGFTPVLGLTEPTRQAREGERA
jgi:peptide/nickel transport system permease protein